MVRNMGVLLAVSTLLAASPSAAASQISANANRASRPIAPSQSNGSAVGLKPSAMATPRTTAMLRSVWIMLASTCPLEHGGAADRHGAKAVDDAAGHVHCDHDRGALHGGGHRHQQDARRDVVQVAGSPDMTAGEPAGEPVAELAAEDVDEQQQEDDRHADEHQRERRIALQAPKIAAQQVVESVTV